MCRYISVAIVSFLIAIFLIPVFGFAGFFPVLFLCLIIGCFANLGESFSNSINKSNGESDPLTRCPECSEKISVYARKCKHCHSTVEPVSKFNNNKEYINCPYCQLLTSADYAKCEYCNKRL